MISLKPKYVKRYAQMARLLVKYGKQDVVDACGLPISEVEKAEDGKPVSGKPDQLAADLEALGPTFVKLGQLLSTRPDLLSQPYLDALARLQDHVEPVEFDKVRGTIEAELGARISNGFESFEEKPIASASLGQVYRAKLRSGQEVAVKVLRPDIRPQIADDLEAIHELAVMLDGHTAFGRRYGFLSISQSLRNGLLEEVDLRKEARNAIEIGKNLKQFKAFRVPQPILDYCGASVLTMEYISGTKITDISPTVLLEVDRKGLARDVFNAYLNQVLIDGLFHADPHPGNLLFTQDKKIALLDCGMVVRVDPQTRGKLIQLLFAISEGRGEDAATAAQQLGSVDEDFDQKAFREKIRKIVSDHMNVSISQINSGRSLMEIQAAAGESGLRIGHEVTMLGKTLMNLDRTMAVLDPDFDPNKALRQRAATIMQEHSTEGFSFSRLFRSAMEATELAQRLPARLNRITEMAADNQLKLQVHAFDEDKLLAGFQKVANRITVGLLLAGLIVGASLMMNIPTTWTLMGYPAIAIVFFTIAATISLILIGRILSDRTST